MTSGVYIDYDLIFNDNYNYNDFTNISRNRFIFFLFGVSSYCTTYVYYKSGILLVKEEETFIDVYNYFCNTDKKSLEEIFKEEESNKYLSEYTLNQLNDLIIDLNKIKDLDKKKISAQTNCNAFSKIYTNWLVVDPNTGIPIYLYPLYRFQNSRSYLLKLLNKLIPKIYNYWYKKYFYLFFNARNIKDSDTYIDKVKDDELNYIILNYNLNLAIAKKELINYGNHLNVLNNIDYLTNVSEIHYRNIIKYYKHVLEKYETFFEITLSYATDNEEKIARKHVLQTQDSKNNKLGPLIYTIRISNYHDRFKELIPNKTTSKYVINNNNVLQVKIINIKANLDDIITSFKKKKREDILLKSSKVLQERINNIRLYRNLLFDNNNILEEEEKDIRVNDYDFPT